MPDGVDLLVFNQKCALVLYLPGRSDHNHHLLQVELVSGEVLNGHVVFDLTARLACVVEQLPEVGDPGLQQDELRGEPLQHHGHQAVCTSYTQDTDAA